MRFEVSRIDSPRVTPPCEGAYQLPGKAGEFDAWYIDVGSLEELLALSWAVGHDLILSPSGGRGVPWVRIYDGLNE